MTTGERNVEHKRKSEGSWSSRNLKIHSARMPAEFLKPKKPNQFQFAYKNELYTPNNANEKNKDSLIIFDRLSPNHSRFSRLRSHSHDRAWEKDAKKKTKVIAGHAMAVRDNRRGTLKDHKLFSLGKYRILVSLDVA